MAVDASGVTTLLLTTTSDVPRTVRRHACVVFWMLRSYNVLHKTLSAPLIAAACLLVALKERNRTHIRVDMIGKLTDDECADVVSVELLATQTIRHNVMLIEGCLRVCFRRLADITPPLLLHREQILRVALSLSDLLYRCEACLYAEESACALIAVAAQFLHATNTPIELTSSIARAIAQHLCALTSA